jgi:predicted phage terminase large subunit-like protein
VITTTPRPLPLLEKIMHDPLTVATRGSTFDNATNLAPTFLKAVQDRYGQTQMGAQELYGEILTQYQGALWHRDKICYQPVEAEDLKRVVIAIDPATTHHNASDETGIIVAGLHTQGFVVILDDLSGRHSPAHWGQRVVEAYEQYKADRVVAEVNKGGDLVERIITSIDPHVSYRAVRATRGKVTRAEPVAALYEQGKVVHQRPLRELETQLCTYVPNQTSSSPDRMDALVWAVTDLMLRQGQEPKIWMA